MVFVLVSARASDSKAMFLYDKHTHTHSQLVPFQIQNINNKLFISEWNKRIHYFRRYITETQETDKNT